MASPRERVRRWFAGWGTAMLTGGFFAVVVGRSAEAQRHQVPALFLWGALYGLAVLGLVRLFGTRRWGYLVAGLLSGPLPGAIFMGNRAEGDDRGFVLVGGMLLGLFVALMEWARVARPLPEAGSPAGASPGGTLGGRSEPTEAPEAPEQPPDEHRCA